MVVSIMKGSGVFVTLSVKNVKSVMFHKTHVGVKCKQVPSLLEIKQFILVSYLLVLMLDFLLNSVDVLI